MPIPTKAPEFLASGPDTRKKKSMSVIGIYQQLPSQMLLTTWVCRWYDDEQRRKPLTK